MVATTKDGFTLRAFSSMYVDWGLEISHPRQPGGESLFYNPSCLSAESWGTKPHPKYGDWDEADQASREGDEDAFVPWNEEDWKEALLDQADELIEAYCDEETLRELGFYDPPSLEESGNETNGESEKPFEDIIFEKLTERELAKLDNIIELAQMNGYFFGILSACGLGPKSCVRDLTEEDRSDLFTAMERYHLCRVAVETMDEWHLWVDAAQIAGKLFELIQNTIGIVIEDGNPKPVIAGEEPEWHKKATATQKTSPKNEADEVKASFQALDFDWEAHNLFPKDHNRE